MTRSRLRLVGEGELRLFAVKPVGRGNDRFLQAEPARDQVGDQGVFCLDCCLQVSECGIPGFLYACNFTVTACPCCGSGAIAFLFHTLGLLAQGLANQLQAMPDFQLSVLVIR